jgi:C-terminal processing protease CtpA/Prc
MVVKRVKSDGAAASTGALFAGDRVLRINGTALDDVTDALHLSKLTHGEALTVAVLQVVRLDGREEEVIIVRGEES